MRHLSKGFDRLGFPVDIRLNDSRDSERPRTPYSVTVTKTKNNEEKFLIDLGVGIEALVLDVQPRQRALLLMIRDNEAPRRERNLGKMLLGHDERQLFVAAVPRNAASVLRALDALKPAEIADAEQRSGIKKKGLHRRKNRARVRQGDFFLLPAPDLEIPDALILKDEPINRGRGASHMVQYLYRTGGQAVWVCEKYPDGVSPETYRELVAANPRAIRWGWQERVREARVYAKGRITHPEHATVVLDMWHRVLPNTEAAFDTFRTMAFID